MQIDFKTLKDNTLYANSLKIPKHNYINGSYYQNEIPETYKVTNPYNGNVICDMPNSSKKIVNRAVDNARKSFNSGEWKNMYPSKRKDILLNFAKLLEDNFKELAFLKTIEMGKPIRYSATLDIKMCLNPLRYAAEALDKIFGKVAPTPAHAIATISREPIGVIGAITPWNFPMMMSLWKFAPALALGNSVVLKPAEQTPFTALKMAELAHKAGVPKGVFNVVIGKGEITGKALALHNNVDCIAFTGSTQVAKLLLQYSGLSNMKRVSAETGGKTPNIIFEDAYDLEYTSWQAAFGVFFNSGAMCVAGSRVLVQESILDKVVEILKKAASKMLAGNPLDPNTRFGPVIDKNQFEKIQFYIKNGIDEGAKLAYGGKAILKDSGGYFIEPTIFVNVKNTMKIAQEEIFGPVISVISFKDEEDAVRIANDSNYGLAAAIWTSDIAKALRMSKNISVGSVWINNWEGHDQTVPFGGFKQSGFGGKDKALEAFDKYSNIKTTWIHIDGKGILKNI